MKIVAETVDSHEKTIADSGITLSENQLQWLAELFKPLVCNDESHRKSMA